jgi:hypothetical protein
MILQQPDNGAFEPVAFVAGCAAAAFFRLRSGGVCLMLRIVVIRNALLLSLGAPHAGVFVISFMSISLSAVVDHHGGFLFSWL